ncbi:MAG TPA: hypothetical protein PKA62_11005 [Thermoanaerobaculia bacterium]|nr:hypothetical protein [Thermoanaerobaculia bacterium]
MSGARLVVGVAGTSLTPAERSFLSERRPAGVLLFPENLASAEQAVDLVAEVRAACSPSPLLFVDQEGGPVVRSSASPFPRRPLSPRWESTGSTRGPT